MRPLSRFLCAVLAVGPATASGHVVATRGQNDPVHVFLPDDAGSCEHFAAEELQLFLRRLTDVDSVLVSSPTATAQIVLGRTAVGEEGFRLVVEDGRLFIDGRGRGALYGVYELLERFGGCAWYSPSCEIAPRLDSFAVPSGLDETQRPAFALRSQNVGFDRAAHVFALRNKMNPEGLPPAFGGSRFRFDRVLGKCHTFNALLPPARWFDTHPEYFSEVNGRRVRDRTQLCLSNPDVLRICTGEVLKRIAASYGDGIRYYGVSPNDWMNFCTCPVCAAIDRREKSHAGSLIAFVNAIAEAVERRYPDVIIQTLAYSYTRRPPATVRPRRNVQICLCTIECDFFRSIATSRATENRMTRFAFAKWQDAVGAGQPLSVWDYTTDFACFSCPWPVFRSLHGNLRFYRSHNVDQVFLLGDGRRANDVWCDLRQWMGAKWMWNPELEEAPLLDRAFRDLFGPAASELRACYERMHGSVRDTHRFPMGCFTDVRSTLFPADCLPDCLPLLSAAAEKSMGTPYAAAVARARVPFDLAAVLRGWGRPSLGRDVSRIDTAEYAAQQEAARRVLETSAGAEMRLADDGEQDATFKARLAEFAARRRPEHPSRRAVFEEIDLSGVIYAGLERTNDVLAADGRAVVLSATPTKDLAWFDLRNVIADPDGVYLPRVRIRTAGGKPGHARFRAGVYNRFRGKSVLSYTSKGGERHDGYAWHTLGDFTPVSGDWIWIGLADPAVTVFIDRLELVRVESR